MKFEPPHPAFFSYSHRDRRHLDDLMDALAAFRLRGDVDNWDDREIRAGQEWKNILLERARKSRLFLLLITNRFIGSTYCVATELHVARTLYDKRLAAIVPVQVEDCDWEIDGLRDLLLIRPFDKPVTHSRRDRSWTEVSKAVKKVADDLSNDRYFPRAPSGNKAIPVMLPYSIGRDGVDEEEKRFETALVAAARDRPFVCILSGSRQGQGQFIDRLAGEGGPIPRLFGTRWAHNPIVADNNNRWIGSGEPAETMLDLTLATVDPPPDAVDRISIAASVHKNPGATIIRFELSASQWVACGALRLVDFLGYWNEWPQQISDPPTLVFVCLDADVSARPITGGFWLALESITRATVDAWIEKPEIRNQFLTARIAAELPHAFGAADRLRMDDLAERLLPLLRKYQI
jgi:TIR domain